MINRKDMLLHERIRKAKYKNEHADRMGRGHLIVGMAYIHIVCMNRPVLQTPEGVVTASVVARRTKYSVQFSLSGCMCYTMGVSDSGTVRRRALS